MLIRVQNTHKEDNLVKKLYDYLESHPNFTFFLKYFGLFLLLLITVSLATLHKIIAVESNPFFYATF